ncbi:4-(cytidine 5'-diphospho)-2-C-methyl-D-erythritol kinase [Motilibacter deserti]|uniref:4-diphosphocytidyl-2-C-methyl-D-erythritol kinase n=1 Tax=Motilibacter deserti TaxID=2714956 RepID=A0ABX0H1N1_9ACTN|nr:4-(cytidine 5'-diphospho)-2-C-methyl-D-erythritol kinase [Motilibacter deserti]NHC15348.1 4-(cytidine 5'-diphospho)-2-C-methyl-D-erythritol kinase [Motilibacter deserti]
MGRRVRVRVPAKVNLQLAVGPLREDGYHGVVTVYQAVGLYDEVTVEAADGLEVVVTGDETVGVPADATNLAAKAAALLAREGGRAPDVRITLRKGIPVAGGMAGGSADAAGALVACNALWELGLDADRLAAHAAALGSDVPFSLTGGTALGVGRGERLTAVLSQGSFTWVFALAEGGLSTPSVYAECDRLRAGAPVPEPAVSDALLSALRAGSVSGVGAALDNDLQAAAVSLHPGLHAVLEAGRRSAVGGLVSGSGPTCAFLAADREAAARIVHDLEAVEGVRGVRTASAPAHGARLLDPQGA